MIYRPEDTTLTIAGLDIAETILGVSFNADLKDWVSIEKEMLDSSPPLRRGVSGEVLAVTPGSQRVALRIELLRASSLVPVYDSLYQLQFVGVIGVFPLQLDTAGSTTLIPVWQFTREPNKKDSANPDSVIYEIEGASRISIPKF